MQTMKKILAVLLTLLIAVTMTAALTGCGDDDEDSGKKKSKKTKKSDTSASQLVSLDDEEDWDDDDFDDVIIDDDFDDDWDDSSDFFEVDVELATSAYMNAMIYGDAEELLDCALPNDTRLWNAVEAEGSSRQDLLTTFESILSVIQDIADEGAEFSFDVLYVTETDVSSLGSFKSAFDSANMPITQSATATISFDVSYEGESNSQEMVLTCYQCEGDWYCIGDLSNF